MVAPLIYLTNYCCEKVKTSDLNGKLSVGDKIGFSALAFDSLLSISALVIGILGVLSVITLPTAAAYSLIGVSGGITLLWIALVIKHITCPDKQLSCFEPNQEIEETSS